MANVTVQAIKELMSITGVGMMDCKRALVAADGDQDKAIEALREKGLATQAKKSGRAAAEGVVATVVNNGVGVMVEINTETDFAANTDDFKAFASSVANTIVEKNPADVDALKATTISGGDKTVDEVLTELAGMKIRENIVIRRFVRLEGTVASYVHNGGSIGVLVKMDTDIKDDAVLTVGKDVAMQSAALNPAYLKRDEVPAEVLDKEKEIMMAQMAEDPKMANKPEQVRAKIVEGKVGKYYKENCLVDQEFVKDNSKTVGAYTKETAKALGCKLEIAKFVRFEKGEGLEKRQDDFAAEVANMVK